MATQALKVQSSGNPMQNRDRAIERVNSWPEWKRTAFSYRSQEAPSSEKTLSVDDDCQYCESNK
jgi:hypothetical protein